MPRFQDIPQFTSFSGYTVDVGWDYLPRTIATHVSDYLLNMEPDFQRGYVWKPEQKVKYVEYALQGGQSGRDIWFNCPDWHTGGRTDYVLVDGKQRLDAALGFLNNEFSIFGGNLYRDYTDRLRLGLGGGFRWHVNTLRTRDQCLQWYVDLNTGGTIHSDDEINRVRALIGAGGWVAPTEEEIRKYAGFDRQIIQAAVAEELGIVAERKRNAAEMSAKTAQETREEVNMDLEDLQAEIGDVRNELAEVTICLDNAESCETEKDFTANIDQAIEGLDTLRKNLVALKNGETL